MKREQEPIVDGLLQFLIKAKKEFASGAEVIKEEDGSFSLKVEDGDFKFHDNWKGGEPFGGSETVWYKGKPIWMMVYFGEDMTGNEGAIPTLRKALSQMPEDFPARGPRVLVDGEYKYENNWFGEIGKFDGKESIYQKGNKVYYASYHGGFIDQRRD